MGVSSAVTLASFFIRFFSCLSVFDAGRMGDGKWVLYSQVGLSGSFFLEEGVERIAEILMLFIAELPKVLRN